jgi:hypothetical protein
MEKTEEKGLFESQPDPKPCSWNECTQGHRWTPTILGAPCNGCRVTTIAVKKENCPFCNEPPIRTSLRIDFVPRGGGISMRCKGQEVQGESVDVMLERTQWREVQEKYKTFEEKQQEEASAAKVN